MASNRKMNVQLFIAVFLCVGGMALLLMGFWVPPIGEIHNSVLIAYGEVATFAGGLLGMDYTYKNKYKKNVLNTDDNGQNNSQKNNALRE